MTGGWGTPRVPVVQAIKEAADNYRRRYREGTYLPPSNDPERPPKGIGSVSNPQRTRVDIIMNVVTGRCNDGYHDDCHGHLLGVPCCCDCHTACAHDFQPRWEGDDPARWTCAICLAPRTDTEENPDEH